MLKKFDYFMENPTDFACDNCIRSDKCDIAYSYGEDYTRCFTQKVVVNIRDDILKGEV